MADIVLINPRFEVSYWGMEHALPLLGKRANLPVACLPLLAALTPEGHTVTLIDENVEWLTSDQKVEIDKSTQKSNDFEAGGMSWKSLAWEGKSEEWGPANIILAFADTGNGKVLMVTYWVTKKGEARHGKQLATILDSVKKIGG